MGSCCPHTSIQNVIRCRFVLQKKRGESGEVVCFKAHLVAQGFSQREGVDFSETFAPMVKSVSLQVFLPICADHGWRIQQMDIKSAYLNGVVVEEIYMHQPKGYEEPGKEHLLVKLNKGLYSLKQAGQEWYATLCDFLVNLGFRRTHADHSVFIFKQGRSIIIIPIYVDDKLLAGNDDPLLDSIQKAISSCFKTTNLGTAMWILGIQVCCDIATGMLSINQSQYLKGALLHFGMANCMPVIIPLPAGKHFEPALPDDHASVTSYPYLKVIGSLMYTTMGTGPDIAAAVHSLLPFAATFGHEHIDGLKHIMRYLWDMLGQGILYTMGGGGLVGYTDAYDTTNCCSILGFTFLYAGGTISWMSKQQLSTALSSTHVEYVAAAEAAKELVWLHCLLSKVCKDVVGPTTLYIDNWAADLLACNPMNHSPMMHIDVCYCYIWECIHNGLISLQLIGSNNMAMDIMTKSL